MEGFEWDVVLGKKDLVVAKTLQQVPLGKTATTLPSCQSVGGNAFSASAETIDTGKDSVALDLSLLTQHAGEHPLWFGSRCGCGRGGRYLCLGPIGATCRRRHGKRRALGSRVFNVRMGTRTPT